MNLEPLSYNVGNEEIHMKKIPNLGQGNGQSESDRVYYSVVEKESESGLSYNRRLFFLHDEHSIGYVSEPSESFQVEKAKEEVQLIKLRKVVPKDNVMTLVFEAKGKKEGECVERKWNLRMKNKKMTDSWTDIINYQVQQIPSRKTTITKQNSEESLHRRLSQSAARRDTVTRQKPQEGNDHPHPLEDAPGDQPRNLSQEIENKPIVNSVDSKQPELTQQQKGEDSLTMPLSLKANKQQPEQSSPQISKEDEAKKNFDSIPSNKHSKYRVSEVDVSGKSTQRVGWRRQRGQEDIAQFELPNASDSKENSFDQKVAQLRAENSKKFNGKYMSFLNYFIDARESHPLKDSSSIANQKREAFDSFCERLIKLIIDGSQSLDQFFLLNHLKSKYGSVREHQDQEIVAQTIELLQNVLGSKSIINEELALSVAQNILIYETEDLQLYIPLLELKTLPSLKAKGDNANSVLSEEQQSTAKICENSLVGEFEARFKNLTYVVERVQRNSALKQGFLVPMHSIAQYKGFKVFIRTKYNLKTAFAKGNEQKSLFQDPYKGIRAEKPFLKPSLSEELNEEQLLEKFCQFLHVHPEVLESPNCLQLIAIPQQKHPSKIVGPKFIVTFADLLPTTGVSNVPIHASIFLSEEQVQVGKAPQVQSRGSSSLLMSSQRPKYASSTSKSNSILSNPRSVQHYNPTLNRRMNEAHLLRYQALISNQIQKLATDFDTLYTEIGHPRQMSKLLNQYGLRACDLGEVLLGVSQKGENGWVKSLIKTEIALECLKLILEKKQQELFLDSEGSMHQNRDPKKGSKSSPSESVCNLLTMLLTQAGAQKSTFELLWKVLSLHSQILFGTAVDPNQMHKGYFLLGLVDKCNIALVLQEDKTAVQRLIQQMFAQHLQKDASLKKAQRLPLKTINFKYQTMLPNRSLDHSTANIQDATKPPKLKDLIVPKNSEITSEKQASKVSRIEGQQDFSVLYNQTLNSLSHDIKRQKKGIVETVQSITEDLSLFYPYHPALSRFYHLLSQYYISSAQKISKASSAKESKAQRDGLFESALQCSKASLSNMLKICEGNSSLGAVSGATCKLACVYFNLSHTYFSSGRVDDSLTQLKRAKHILESAKNRVGSSSNLEFAMSLQSSRDFDREMLYARVLAKMGQTLLLKRKPSQAAQNFLVCRSTLQKLLSAILPQSNQAMTEASLFMIKTVIKEWVEVHESVERCQQSLASRFERLSNQEANLYKELVSGPLQTASSQIETLERVIEYERSLKSASSQQIQEPHVAGGEQICSIEILQRTLRLVLPVFFSLMQNEGALTIFSTYILEVFQKINRRGIIFNKLSSQNQGPVLSFDKQSSGVTQNLGNNTFPSGKANKSSSYSIVEAFEFVKSLISRKNFCLVLKDYILNTAAILEQLREQVRYSSLNSSRVEGGGFQQGARNGNEENLFLKSSQVRNKNPQSQTSQYDSFMKALFVLVGEGHIMHLFDAQ